MTGQPSCERLLAAHVEAAAVYHRHLAGPDGDAPRSYLTGRGLGQVLDPASAWDLGYAPPGWTALTDHLIAVGFTTTELLDAGLVARTQRGDVIDRFRDRITLPIRDSGGRIIGFIGRSAPQAGLRGPKYLNSPTTPIYRKGQSLFGLWEQRDQLRAGAQPVLVEGPLDVLAVAAAAHTGRRQLAGVAACGTALTSQQAALLAAAIAAGTDVVVAYDSDPAGAAAADNAYVALRQPGMAGAGELLRACLPKGMDPADLLRVHGPAGLAAALTRNLTPLVDHAIDTRLAGHARVLDGIDGRLAATRHVAHLVATVRPDLAARYVVRLARQLDLDPITVSIAITDALTTTPMAQTRRPRTRGPTMSSRLGMPCDVVQPPV
jgi:DNA primase